MEYLTLDTKPIKINKQYKETYYSYRYKKIKQNKKAKTGFKDFTRGVKLSKKYKKYLKRKKPQREYNQRVPKQYATYIKSKYWEKRRNKYFKEHGRQCCVCGSFKNIQLHHAKYIKEDYGIEPDNYMFPFCSDHHEAFHTDRITKSNMLQDTLLFIKENYIPHESILR